VFHVEQGEIVPKKVIDYHTPRPPLTRERVASWSAVGGAYGAAVTLPAIFLALRSTGASHGNYGYARGLFPIPMLATLLTGNSITLLSIVVGFAQYPLYGVILGRGIAARRWGLILVMLAIHLAAVWLCFAGIIANFS
jgi:hypothetical protein